MRHKVRGRKLGRERDYRRLLLKNLVKSLVLHGRINTTLAKAKELRRVAERLVTYGKKGCLFVVAMHRGATCATLVILCGIF